MNDDPQTTYDEVDADTVASRAAQVISSMGADIRALTGERDRYRLAWRSARERAQAYGEGILRHVADRDAWKGWCKEAEARTAASAVPVAAPPTEQTALASLAMNAGRALQDEKRHYQIACQENARLRGVIARLRQTTDHWEQRLPELIRTPAVVSAIRAALEAAEDPARIDRLRPEFTEHASIETIDAQLRRSRAQERRWHIRTEWLISLRAGRVAQKERGEWSAAAPAVVQADGEA